MLDVGPIYFMQLSHYITPDEIIVPLKGTTKEDVYRELVKHLSKQNKLEDVEDNLIEAIFERETSNSTFLPIGVAVPHARVADINDIVLVIGVTPNPILDTAPDAAPIEAHVFCLFFSPIEEKEFGRHLKLLSRIAAVFSDANLVPELAGMKSPLEIFERIQLRERQISEE